MDAARRTYDKHWMPWLQRQLSTLGVPTEAPHLPRPWSPDYQAFKAAFEQYEVDRSTVLVGHSCGAAFLVRWLGETKHRVAKLILVAPWKIPDPGDAGRRAFYEYPIDKGIRSRVDEIVMFTADDEEPDGKESLRIFHRALGGTVVELPGRGHYTLGDMKTEEFPELLERIVTFDNRKALLVPVNDLTGQLRTIIEQTPCQSDVRPRFLARFAEGAMTRSENPISHLSTYFAAHDPDRRLVFLGHHKKSGLWLFNGGHLEPDERPRQAVFREAREEWGMELSESDVGEPALLTIAEIDNPIRPCRRHFDVWYFLAFHRQMFHPKQAALRAEFSRSGWMPLAEARQLVTDPSTLAALDVLERRWAPAAPTDSASV